MPGRDGTGPRGLGPMTGKGLGFCILKLPSTPEEPFVGFVGKTGRPVCFFSRKGESGTDLEELHSQIGAVRNEVDNMGRRLSMLDDIDGEE